MIHGDDLISIVVPIYKAEQYLSQCVNSILEQTYRNIEIILVDDGSPDRCPEICDYFGKTDSRVRVIHQENKGLSAARNIGLEVAKGSYITFIDSDDYVGKHFVERLYDAISREYADISICDYLKVNEDDGLEKEAATYYPFNNRECIKNMYHPTLHGMEFVAWAKMYTMDIFKKNDIMYPVGKIYEDIFTTHKLLYYAKKIVFCDAVLYFYRQCPQSIMRRGFSIKNLQSLEATQEASSFFWHHGESDLFGMALNAHLRQYMCLYYELRKNKHNIDDYERVRERFIAKYRSDVKAYKNKMKLPLKNKIVYWSFYFIPNALWGKCISEGYFKRKETKNTV